jgi:hypothetical protein
MTLDKVLASLFPAGHSVQRGAFHTLHGTGRLASGGEVALIDASIQNRIRRDELLGLNEYFGHLIKVLVIKVLALAAQRDHRTISLLYGPAAGGIATALSTRFLVAIHG